MTIYNHGFAENTDLYDEFMPHIALAGHEVVIYDQRGAGRTSPGKLYALTNEQHVFEDLDALIESVVKTNEGSGLPLVLWGHSMGGGITLNYAIHGKHRDQFAAFMVIAPLIVLNPKSRPNFLLRRLLSVSSAIMPQYRQRAPLALDYITHDETWKKRFASDEATRVVCSAGQMSDMLKRGEKLLDAEYVAGFTARPVAIFHSTTDYINDFQGSVDFFGLLPATVPKKKLYRYTDMGHSLPHETPDRQYKVYSDIVEFLGEVASDGQAADTPA